MKVLFLGVSVIALALAQTAHAQTAPGSTSTSPQAPPPDSGAKQDAIAPSSAPATGLQEIVVTAQRRSENLQKAAVPVDVVTGSTLMHAGITEPTQLSQLVPSLSVQTAGGANTTFFIRGVGNFTVNGYSDPPIAFNYDGVYVGRSSSASGLLYDLERVEVLKGPQGTLYGRNATAGAINVIPTRPELDRTGGYITTGFGNYGSEEVQGAVNLPIGSDVAVRASGNFAHHDGYLSDGTSDDDEQAARLQLLARLTPDVTLRVGADYEHQGGVGPGSNYGVRYSYNPRTQSFVTQPGEPDGTGLLDPASQALRTSSFAGLAGRDLGALSVKPYENNNFYGVNGELEWRTDAGALTIIPALRTADLNNLFEIPGFAGLIGEHDQQYSTEARFSGRQISIFEYVGGLYYFNETIKGQYTFSQDALASYQNFVSKTQSYAAFGRVTAHLTDRLRLVGGLRYTDDQKQFDGLADVVLVTCTVKVANVPQCPAAPVIPVTATVNQLPFAVSPGGVRPIGTTGALAVSALTSVDQPLSNSRATYRAAIEYDVLPQAMAYFSYETGYRSGGFALAAGHQTFQPEYISAYTLGLKTRFLDNKAQVNVEGFIWDYDNQQINHTGVDTAGNTGNFVDNAGSSTNQGIEVDGQLLVTKNTLISADLQYLDAKFNSFNYQQPVGSSPPYTTCAVHVDAVNTALYDVNCSGKPTYQSPKWTLNLGAQHTFPIGGNKIVLEADTQYKTGRYIGFDFEPFEYVGATFTTNAQLSFSPLSDRWTVSAYVRNLENLRIPVYAAEFGIGGLGAQTRGPPRTFGVTLTAKL